MKRPLTLAAIAVTTSMIWSLPAFGRDDFAKEFLQSAYASCYQTQRASRMNSGVSEKFIIDYCSCTSKYIYLELTDEDIARLLQVQGEGGGGPLPYDIQEKLNRAGKNCMKDMISKMSPSELKKMDRLYNQNTQRR